MWLVPREDVEDSKPTELTGPLIIDMTPGSLRLCIPASAQSTTQRPEAEGRKWSGEGRKAQPLRPPWTAEGHSQGHLDQPPAGLQAPTAPVTRGLRPGCSQPWRPSRAGGGARPSLPHPQGLAREHSLCLLRVTIQLLRDHRSWTNSLDHTQLFFAQAVERKAPLLPTSTRRLPRQWACSGHRRADTQPTMETHPRGQRRLDNRAMKRRIWEDPGVESSLLNTERKRSALPLTPGPLCPPLLGLGPRLVPFPGPPWPPVITGDGCLHAARSRASGPVLGEPCPARPARGPPGPARPGLSWRPVPAPAQPLLTAPAPGRGGTVPAGCR